MDHLFIVRHAEYDETYSYETKKWTTILKDTRPLENLAKLILDITKESTRKIISSIAQRAQLSAQVLHQGIL